MSTTGLSYLKGNELWLKKTDGTWLVLDATSIGTATSIGGCVLMSNWDALFAGSIGNFTTTSGNSLQDTENTVQGIIANYATTSQLNTEVANITTTIGSLVPEAVYLGHCRTLLHQPTLSQQSSGLLRIQPF